MRKNTDNISIMNHLSTKVLIVYNYLFIYLTPPRQSVQLE